MPGLTQFLRGFGIHQGLQLAGYILDHVEGNENTVVRYREYEYPIQLFFSPQSAQANPQMLLNQLSQFVSGTRTINSSYGNPYECNFGQLQVTQVTPAGVTVIETLGHSYRV